VVVEPVKQRGPGAHVARLLLAPHHLGVGMPREQLPDGRAGEGLLHIQRGRATTQSSDTYMSLCESSGRVAHPDIHRGGGHDDGSA